MAAGEGVELGREAPVVESDQLGHNAAESLQRRLPSSCSIEFQ